MGILLAHFVSCPENLLFNCNTIGKIFVHSYMKHENLSDKIKLVVVGEHTLGFIFPNSTMLSILRESVLKGAGWRLHDDPLPLPRYGETMRLATEKDFDDFRCSFEKRFYSREEYEYAETVICVGN